MDDSVLRGKAVKTYKGHENKKFCLFAAFAAMGGTGKSITPGGRLFTPQLSLNSSGFIVDDQ